MGQTRSAQFRVGSDVPICTIEIRWHDRRGQHGCVLDRMCLYAPIRKYELLRNRLAMCELLANEMNLNCVMNCIGLRIIFGYC